MQLRVAFESSPDHPGRHEKQEQGDQLVGENGLTGQKKQHRGKHRVQGRRQCVDLFIVVENKRAVIDQVFRISIGNVGGLVATNG